MLQINSYETKTPQLETETQIKDIKLKDFFTKEFNLMDKKTGVVFGGLFLNTQGTFYIITCYKENYQKYFSAKYRDYDEIRTVDLSEVVKILESLNKNLSKAI